MANNAKGIANARENPSIPTIGFTKAPPADSTRMLPTIGPVHEKDTNTIVNAIKNIPVRPPLSACWSALFTIQLGNTISNAPKKEAAKTTNIKKNNTLGSQWVANRFANAGPSNTATSVPIKTYMPTMLKP